MLRGGGEPDRQQKQQPDALRQHQSETKEARGAGSTGFRATSGVVIGGSRRRLLALRAARVEEGTRPGGDGKGRCIVSGH